MCATNTNEHTSLFKSLITNKCPHCRKGDLFTNHNPYHLSTTMRMYEHCPVCGQQYELQTGFYFGTGYVSYALSVLFIILFFAGWSFTLHLSLNDNSIFWCLGTASLILVVLQPLLQRLARSIWIAFFVRYDPNYNVPGTSKS